MTSFRQHLHRTIGRPLQSLAYATGVMQFSARMRNGESGAVILMYHSVANGDALRFIDPRNHVHADVFEQQMEFLAEHRQVVSLTDLVTALKRGETTGTKTVSITFDDGYRDNLTVAAPILSRFGLPAALFLPTGYIDRGEPQWIDQAYMMFKHRRANMIEWDARDGARHFNLDDQGEHHEAYREVCIALLRATTDDRRAMLDGLRDQLKPRETPPMLTMSWDDVQVLREKHPRFEIGGHTVEHTDLTSVTDDVARRDLTGCMERVQAMTGCRPRHFAFPYGRTSPGLRQLIVEAGFESACESGGEEVVASGTDLFALPRVEAPATMRRFDMQTSAANTGLWRRLGR